jgi:hypothetical protein
MVLKLSDCLLSLIDPEEDASSLDRVTSFNGAVLEAGAAAVALRLVDLKGYCTF